MKFYKMPPGYFVCVNTYFPQQLLVKDTKGHVRKMPEYTLAENHGILEDSEVQPIEIGKKDEPIIPPKA